VARNRVFSDVNFCVSRKRHLKARGLIANRELSNFEVFRFLGPMWKPCSESKGATVENQKGSHSEERQSSRSGPSAGIGMPDDEGIPVRTSSHEHHSIASQIGEGVGEPQFLSFFPPHMPYLPPMMYMSGGNINTETSLQHEQIQARQQAALSQGYGMSIPPQHAYPLDTSRLASSASSTTSREYNASLGGFPNNFGLTGFFNEGYAGDQNSTKRTSDNTVPGDSQQRKRVKPWRRTSKASSQYRGVTYHKSDNRYIARAWIHGKTVHLGSFKKEKEAARAVRDKYIEVYGTNEDGKSISDSEEEDIEETPAQSAILGPQSSSSSKVETPPELPLEDISMPSMPRKP